MQITSAIFKIPFGGADPQWVLSIEVEGGEFLHRAAPVTAAVGTVVVEAIAVSLAGDKFAGLLRSSPSPADTLWVGYLDTGLSDTGIVPTSPVSA
jgi:hypothetical protein